MFPYGNTELFLKKHYLRARSPCPVPVVLEHPLAFLVKLLRLLGRDEPLVDPDLRVTVQKLIEPAPLVRVIIFQSTVDAQPQRNKRVRGHMLPVHVENLVFLRAGLVRVYSRIAELDTLTKNAEETVKQII
jgi:hypothetical protein